MYSLNMTTQRLDSPSSASANKYDHQNIASTSITFSAT